MQKCVNRSRVSADISIKSDYWIMGALLLFLVQQRTTSCRPTPVQFPRDGGMVNFQDFGRLSTGATILNYLFD